MAHPQATPEYWRELAASERESAREDTRRKYGSAESIQIHLANAKRYEARAAELEVTQ